MLATQLLNNHILFLKVLTLLAMLTMFKIVDTNILQAQELDNMLEDKQPTQLLAQFKLDIQQLNMVVQPNTAMVML